MTPFERAVEHTLQVEGGFVDDPQDPGGATNWGITLNVFRRWAQRVLGIAGTRDNLVALTRDDAMKVYKSRYWDPHRLDEVAAVDEGVALEVFDTGVNMGPGAAVQFLQRALNAFNNQAAYYDDLEVDGGLGDRTVEALRAFADRRGAEGLRVLVRALNSLQGARYVGIVESRPASEKFIYGWFKQRISLS